MPIWHDTLTSPSLGESLSSDPVGMDLLPGFICFFVGLLYELEMGIFTGVGAHLLIVLYTSARPSVSVELKQVGGGGDIVQYS